MLDSLEVADAPDLHRTTATATVVLGALIFEAALWWAYEHKVAPKYTYALLVYRTPPSAYVLVSIGLAAACAAFLPTRIRRPSALVCWVLYLTVVAPSMIIMYFVLPILSVGPPTILAYQLVLAVCFIALELECRRSVPAYRSPRLDPHEFWTCIVGLAIGLNVLMLVTTGLHLHVPSFTSVYTVRAAYAATVSGPASYASAWLGGVINPFFIAHGLTSKRRAWVVAGAVGQLLIYTTGGFKSVLFSTLLIVGFYVLLGPRLRAKFARNILFIVIGAIALSGLLDTLTHSVEFTSLITRRTFAVPAALTSLYVSFFSHNPLALYSHLTSGFFPAHYSVGPPSVIGNYYFAGTGIDANSNLWADGFAELGLWGLPIVTLIVGLILRWFDGAARSLNARFGALILVIPALSLSNSSVLTVISTHGLGLAVVVALLMPAEIAAGSPTDTSSDLQLPISM